MILNVKYVNGQKLIKIKNHEISEHFNEKYPNVTIDWSTITKILKEKDKWKAVVNAEVSNKTFRQAVLFYNALKLYKSYEFSKYLGIEKSNFHY